MPLPRPGAFPWHICTGTGAQLPHRAGTVAGLWVTRVVAHSARIYIISLHCLRVCCRKAPPVAAALRSRRASQALAHCSRCDEAYDRLQGLTGSHNCAGTGWAHPARICTGTRLAPTTSATGLHGLNPTHICAGTGLHGLTPAHIRAGTDTVRVRLSAHSADGRVWCYRPNSSFRRTRCVPSPGASGLPGVVLVPQYVENGRSTHRMEACVGVSARFRFQPMRRRHRGILGENPLLRFLCRGGGGGGGVTGGG